MEKDLADKLPHKDKVKAHPIAMSWRPLLVKIVNAFVKGDYELKEAIPSVDPVTTETADHIRKYIASYGATLTDIPEATWETSCAQWMGDRWEVLIDLWTKEEGRSDLVLHLNAFESNDEYRFEIYLVFVP
ncbi:MAG: hypothetical protein JF616_21715 [Fibrobacteres bacterium]|jgi:hypothetical protein|nr:hypothetical protein [Fibrobacterota bacterium]